MSHAGNDELHAFASSACSMREAEDSYMGFASRDELVRLLDTVIVATRGLAEAPPGSISDALRRDAARWCAILIRDLTKLDATPSSTRHKAPSISILREQLGTALHALLPKVRDDRLYAELASISRAHRVHP